MADVIRLRALATASWLPAEVINLIPLIIIMITAAIPTMMAMMVVATWMTCNTGLVLVRSWQGAAVGYLLQNPNNELSLA
jgi:hypothetical protein